jgi:hypothetical protein
MKVQKAIGPTGLVVDEEGRRGQFEEVALRSQQHEPPFVSFLEKAHNGIFVLAAVKSASILD